MSDPVNLVSVAHAPGTSRAAARLAIRMALCRSIAEVLGVKDVHVASLPGTAPRLLVGGAASTIGIAISHTDAFAFAAWHPHTSIGLDVMQVVEVPEWRVLARDYLGPQALERLEAVPAHALNQAFAREWTAREASLKALGLGIAEWTALPIACMLRELAPQPGHVGAIAFPARQVQHTSNTR
ncbi:MAG TPA: 4'-phosphopantetheinyl transferase superfamily protein [Telluria sp.]